MVAIFALRACLAPLAACVQLVCGTVPATLTGETEPEDAPHARRSGRVRTLLCEGMAFVDG